MAEQKQFLQTTKVELEEVTKENFELKQNLSTTEKEVVRFSEELSAARRNFDRLRGFVEKTACGLVRELVEVGREVCLLSRTVGLGGSLAGSHDVAEETEMFAPLAQFVCDITAKAATKVRRGDASSPKRVSSSSWLGGGEERGVRNTRRGGGVKKTYSAGQWFAAEDTVRAADSGSLGALPSGKVVHEEPGTAAQKEEGTSPAKNIAGQADSFAASIAVQALEEACENAYLSLADVSNAVVTQLKLRARAQKTNSALHEQFRRSLDLQDLEAFASLGSNSGGSGVDQQYPEIDNSVGHSASVLVADESTSAERTGLWTTAGSSSSTAVPENLYTRQLGRVYTDLLAPQLKRNEVLTKDLHEAKLDVANLITANADLCQGTVAMLATIGATVAPLLAHAGLDTDLSARCAEVKGRFAACAQTAKIAAAAAVNDPVRCRAMLRGTVVSDDPLEHPSGAAVSDEQEMTPAALHRQLCQGLPMLVQRAEARVAAYQEMYERVAQLGGRTGRGERGGWTREHLTLAQGAAEGAISPVGTRTTDHLLHESDRHRVHTVQMLEEVLAKLNEEQQEFAREAEEARLADHDRQLERAQESAELKAGLSQSAEREGRLKGRLSELEAALARSRRGEEEADSMEAAVLALKEVLVAEAASAVGTRGRSGSGSFGEGATNSLGGLHSGGASVEGRKMGRNVEEVEDDGARAPIVSFGSSSSDLLAKVLHRVNSRPEESQKASVSEEQSVSPPLKNTSRVSAAEDFIHSTLREICAAHETVVGSAAKQIKTLQQHHHKILEAAAVARAEREHAQEAFRERERELLQKLAEARSEQKTLAEREGRREKEVVEVERARSATEMHSRELGFLEKEREL